MPADVMGGVGVGLVDHRAAETALPRRHYSAFTIGFTMGFTMGFHFYSPPHSALIRAVVFVRPKGNLVC